MVDAALPGKRRRGRQKTTWKEACKRDMESVGLKEEDAQDRTKWKNDIHNHSGDDDRKSPRRKRRTWYACACMSERVSVCVRACVCACVRGGMPKAVSASRVNV